MLSYLDPQPVELPARLASPFAGGPPHPLACRAAEALQAELRGGLAGGISLAALDEPGQGKMFGVLVVAAPDGRIGWLKAFSGMLAGRWRVGGFAPPLFDERARDAFWPAGEAELRELDRAGEALRSGHEIVALRAERGALAADHAAAAAALEQQHHANRRARHATRAGLDVASEILHALAQQSRGDQAERRRLDEEHRRRASSSSARLHALDEARAAIERRRAERSRELLQQLWDTYDIRDARGERRSLCALFAPAAPPGGAGDCAAPRLFAEAHRRGLRPLALAELWWGAPPPNGSRRAGQFYAACRGSCGVILPYMLRGLDVEPAPLFGAELIADDEPRVVFEDEWLLVVDKPCGLLSVPGRHALLRDSVLARLRRRYPHASGPLVVHRLDLDTSGLLLAAKDARTHAALQRQFERREIDKRYVAWLDGNVTSASGVIELSLRVDLDDRPRQIHDPLHGKRAITEWRVLERRGARTRVALFPRTGRTHQLRVHAAHPAGLDVPIVGDRLYGRADARLMLHAEGLELEHPHTHARLELERPAPF